MEAPDIRWQGCQEQHAAMAVPQQYPVSGDGGASGYARVQVQSCVTLTRLFLCWDLGLSACHLTALASCLTLQCSQGFRKLLNILPLNSFAPKLTRVIFWLIATISVYFADKNIKAWKGSKCGRSFATSEWWRQDSNAGLSGFQVWFPLQPSNLCIYIVHRVHTSYDRWCFNVQTSLEVKLVKVKWSS